GGRQHDLENLPPFCLRKLRDGRNILDSCIVHQDVYLPLRRDGLGHKLLKILSIRHIRLLETRSRQLCCDGLSLLDVDIRACHAHPLMCEITSNGQSNTRGGTCHQGNLAFQTCHTNSSFRLCC